MNKDYLAEERKEEIKVINLDSDKVVYVQFGSNFLELQSSSIYQDSSCIRANLEFVKNKNFEMN